MLKFLALTLALPLVMFLFPFGSNDGLPASQFVFNADERILTLRGNWKFQAGDDPRWSRPDFPDADWRTMAVPGMWVRELEKNYGIAWYRAWVEIPAKVDTGMQWGFNIIQVNVAADIFWDGALMARHGTVGISQAAEVPSQSNHL